MALLTSQANRLNDVEINNNKPVTSQVMRRIGSSVNFLLDLVGATDGSTSTGGALGELAQSEQTLSFSISNIVSMTLNSPVNIMTFSGSDNRHLSWVRKNGSGFSAIPASSGTAEFGNGVITELLMLLQYVNQPVATALSGNPALYDITVDGVLAARLSRTSIAVFFDLKTAPAGNHTIALTRVGAVSSTIGSATFAHTFSKLFI